MNQSSFIFCLVSASNYFEFEIGEKCSISGAENYWNKEITFNLPDPSFFVPGGVYELQILDFPKADPNWGTGQVEC